jgi:membrane associated rhomboid family serine protease
MSAEPDADELAEIGHHKRRRDAEECGLVLLAMGIGYWIFRRDGEHALCVEPRNREAALRELKKYEAERSARTPPIERAGFGGKTSNLSLFVFGWALAMFFLAQQLAPPWWMEKGSASGDAILRGEWWRAITALTLHADTEHLVANLATGLLFAAFLVPLLGTGLAWFSIVLSGALGNFFNALLYRNEPHDSIGASTAVFGALGILVAWQVVAQILSIRKFRAWELIVPTGAGLALLAWLGVGEEHSQTDYMAHFFGLVAGALLGAIIAVLHLEKRTSVFQQRILAVLALAVPLVSWFAVWKF